MKQLRGEELVRLNVRVPKKLYEWVKKVAYERDESQSTVVALALEKGKKNARKENASR